MKRKTLMLFLSASGNTKALAREVAFHLSDVDLKEIKLLTSIPTSKFFLKLKFGFYLSFSKKFNIIIPNIDPEKYDQVIFGGPVWMGKMSMPLIQGINTFNWKAVPVGVFATYNGEEGQVFEDFKAKTNKLNIVAELSMKGGIDLKEQKVQDEIKRFLDSMTYIGDMSNLTNKNDV